MRISCLISFALAVISAFSANSPLTSLELSHDNGNIESAYDFLGGAGYYVAVQYEAPSGGPWYLSGIKYYVWWQNWPDSIYQGFGVGCWKMEGGTPGTLVWPTDGELMYNPNTGGYWIVQPVEPYLNLTLDCPNGFVVGIDFLYPHPQCDGIGEDFTGPGPYDWWHTPSAGWYPAAYGKNAIRSLINNVSNPGVETSTIGQIRALYR